jgi:hypothetical protein
MCLRCTFYMVSVEWIKYWSKGKNKLAMNLKSNKLGKNCLFKHTEETKQGQNMHRITFLDVHKYLQFKLSKLFQCETPKHISG